MTYVTSIIKSWKWNVLKIIIHALLSYMWWFEYSLDTVEFQNKAQGLYKFIRIFDGLTQGWTYIQVSDLGGLYRSYGRNEHLKPGDIYMES